MNILRLDHAELSYGEHRILHDATLQVDSGERLALIGRNGTGKSTLLSIFNGTTSLDDGTLWHASGLKIAFLDQSLPAASTATLREIVTSGLHATEDTVRSAAQWNAEHKVERVLELMKLPADLRLADSSGGMQRRTMLARALVAEPDLLLLDEPTNHLDIPAIEALQQTLLSSTTTLVLVSHDRTLIDAVATRIVELDRGELISYPGNFATYQARKAKAEEEEAIANAKFDRVLADEEKWIRQGIKARRTRNEGRVRRLQGLRKERSQRINKQGNVRLQLDTAERSGNLVAALENVSFGYDKPLLSNFSTQIMRGDRIAIIGPNGSGKSTLIRLILGELEPASGTITRGSRLQIAYFDQERSALDLSKSIRDNVSPGSDHIDIGGSRKHVAGYLADFMFPSGSLQMPVARLSGGEKNRLLMARLFAQPANVLVLDEPTNDLDMETLELFEELLTNFDGTIVLVSHDRAFIDAVATSTVVFTETGSITESVGGFTDWLRQQERSKSNKSLSAKQSDTHPAAQGQPDGGASTDTRKDKRLGYKAKRELAKLPAQIEALEEQQLDLQQRIMAADFYQQDEATVKSTLAELQTLGEQIESAYARWEELSDQE